MLLAGSGGKPSLAPTLPAGRPFVLLVIEVKGCLSPFAVELWAQVKLKPSEVLLYTERVGAASNCCLKHLVMGRRW